MDKKRLNNEEAPQIKQGEIDAWARGKGDALRNKLLAASRKLSTKRAISLVKMFAQLGDIHYLAMRFDVSADEIRKILGAFEIRSIEDAKTVVRSGIIAELDDAEAENQEERATQSVEDHTEAAKRLEEQQAALEAETATTQETDEALAARRDDAQRKNKEDRLRQLISEGLDSATNKRKFKIPLSRVREFRKGVYNGVSHLQREFGGSAADIVSEIERLAPEVDLDMLRP